MKRYRDTLCSVVLLGADFALLALIVMFSVHVRLALPWPSASARQLWNSLLPFLRMFSPMLFFALLLIGAYRMPCHWMLHTALMMVGKAVLIAVSLAMIGLFVLRFGIPRSRPVHPPSRLTIMFICIGVIFCLSFFRVFVGRQLSYQRIRHDVPLPVLRVAMLGSRGVPAHYGGVETYVEEVGRVLVEHGCQVTVYCHAKYVLKRGTHQGMELRFLPTIRTKHLETIVHTFLATLHALYMGADIFHYHALGPTTLAWLPRLFGQKVVTTVQGLDWQRAKWGRIARWYLKFGEWAACHFPHITIVVSHTLAQHYADRYHKKTVYIPNGCALPQPKPPESIRAIGLDSDTYILFVGRLTPEKGCHTLLEAFRHIRTEKHLVLAGEAMHDDAYSQRLQRLANKSPRIHFTGFAQGDLLRELYSNAYFVVLPSTLEGLSVVLLEARSYGNCLLVSDIPENVEVVRERGGYTFRAGDVHHLREQLQWLLGHPEQIYAVRTGTGANTPYFWTWDKVGKATQEIYNTLSDIFS